MERADADAIGRVGIPRLLLMEHAGIAVARAAERLLGARRGSVVICCGMGFNGGDGLCAGRHLHEAGHAVHIVLGGSIRRLRKEPAIYAGILRRLGVPIAEVGSAAAARRASARLRRWLGACDVVVDALLGIGVRGAAREPVASLIGAINRAGKPVVAVDVPSGLDADTGAVQGEAIAAAVTVTFGLVKRGCVMGEGPARAGTLLVDSITIPRSVLRSAGRSR
jgi:NAD(P)H-hydrate epimerase